MQPVLNSHIELDDRGVARIAGTRFKVRFIAVERTALGMTPEEIVAAHPDVLTLADVHAALAFYYDNKEVLDAEIAASAAEADRLRQENLDSPVRRKLRAAGKLP